MVETTLAFFSVINWNPNYGYKENWAHRTVEQKQNSTDRLWHAMEEYLLSARISKNMIPSMLMPY